MENLQRNSSNACLRLLAVLFAVATASSLDAELPQVAQWIRGDSLQRFYPNALPSLLETLRREASVQLDATPRIISKLDEADLAQSPLLYINAAETDNWQLADSEKGALAAYLQRGGFALIDAGVNADFLRDKDAGVGQSHSFAEWRVTPELESLFAEILPEASFAALPRDHEIFRSFYHGLPDASNLPDSVREYVVNEKWPQGTYSLLGLYFEGRIVAIASPILAMGWGRSSSGEWTTTIGFRIRESADGLDERLARAVNTGTRYETTREDRRKDVIYTQELAKPAWVNEPSGQWRVFRYYHTTEISDYAHTFYTRLGVNIFLYALLN